MTAKHSLLTLVAACTALCLAVLPLSAETFGDFTYTDDGTSITISGYVISPTDSVEIPAVIAGKPVSRIGDYAFINCIMLTSVTIPSSVSSIGDFAFHDCSGLTSVTIPSSVTSIGASAFGSCNALTSVVIPDKIIRIENHLFTHCTSLTRVTIPSSVTSIGGSAFYGCSSLTSVTIPSNVTSIDDFAFSACDGLVRVKIPSGVTHLGINAFGYCRGLTAISVDPANQNYTSVGGILFSKAKNVLLQYPAGIAGNYSIPSSVTIIGSGAFQGCGGLTSVTIPPSVTAVGKEAFSSCGGLNSVTIPSSVTSIGERAFFYCSSLTSIRVDKANPEYSSLRGSLIKKTQNVLLQCPGGIDGNYVIPSSVTGIGDFAFSYCAGLTSVTIPSSVTSIGWRAFTDCVGLTSVTIPSSVTNIGSSAFIGCSGLISFKFLGDAPSYFDGFMFYYAAPGFKINYIKGNTGFTSPKWLGYPCVGLSATPEIDVQQPAKISLVDGTAKKSFGTVVSGSTSTSKTFTLSNFGMADLAIQKITMHGENPGDFTYTAVSGVTLIPGASVKFKVAFAPTAAETRTATLQIHSNDADESPFGIHLSGMGAP